MEQTIQLQFLDLDDVDTNVKEYVKSIINSSSRSPRLQLPWVEPEEAHHQWSHGHYDGEELSEMEAGIVPTPNELYQMPVPVQTTVPQLYQVVQPMAPSYIPPAYIPPTFVPYPDERPRKPRSKPSPKRNERREPSSYPPAPPASVQYAPTYPIHMAMSPTAYPYIPQPGPHMPSAQHAAGTPLYIASPTTQVVFYPGGYPPVFSSPHVQADDYGEEEPAVSACEVNPQPAEPEAPPPEKPPSIPINAIKTTAPPTVPVKKQQPTAPPPAETAPPPPAASLPEVAPTNPTPVEEKAPPPPEPGKSWAALFKSDGPVQRKPPISAVAVSRPILDTNTKPTLLVPPSPRPPQPESDEDPLLKRLGECLSSYQLEHKAQVLTPRGLTNPSNYCYINATLQALLACPAFYNLIKVISQVKDACGPVPGALPPKSRTPIIDSMVLFIKEFSPAPVNRSGRKEKSMWKEKQEELDVPVGPSFEPSYVYKMLHALRNETAFQVEGRQEDAEEFLSLLLNGLNDEMLELVKLVEDKNKENPVLNGDVTANGETHSENNSDWKEVSKGVKSGRITRRAEMGRTPLSEIFRGQLRSRLQRTDEESTDNVQPFFTLQLDIESSESVPEALDKYFGGREQVEGGQGGSGGGEMWQQHSLEELPNVLILHLKCFLYRQQSCHKIAKALDFPIDLKIDPKFLSNKNKGSSKMRQYKLFAVVYHDGKEASKGHYLADAYHVGSGVWLRYDDSVVRPVSEATLLKPKPPRVPYLLYYRRVDTVNQHSQLPR